MPIPMLLTVCQSHNKLLRYSKFGTKILSMFNFLSQHIARDFEASQPLLNAPSQVCSIASCGLGLYYIVGQCRGMLYLLMKEIKVLVFLKLNSNTINVCNVYIRILL